MTLELRGGTAPELFERLRSEGDDTPADLLVTTDLANLWRAEEAGLLAAGRRPRRSSARCPRACRDPDGSGGASAPRIRTPMRSTERVGADAVTSYEDLGDPQFKGRSACAPRNNEYNQSLRRRPDRQARRGRHREAAALLDGQRAADPRLRRRRARGDRGRPTATSG